MNVFNLIRARLSRRYQRLGAGRNHFCVVATAGTTSSGIIDDLPAIASICRRNNLWMHVDGAYGASVIFSDRYRSLVQGIELADSLQSIHING